MTDLTSMTIAEAKAGLANKSFTSLELTDAHLAAIEAARALMQFTEVSVPRAEKRAMHEELRAMLVAYLRPWVERDAVP